MLTEELVKTLHRTLAYANERHHEYATPEHLLIALTEDNDAVDVFAACLVNVELLRHAVLSYLDTELGSLVSTTPADAKPTASFQRILQRAAIHVQAAGWHDVSGANVLLAMFPESEIHATYILAEHHLMKDDVADYISRRMREDP